MTIMRVTSPEEFLPIGAPSSSTATASVIYHEFTPPRPQPLPGTVRLDSLIRDHEADPEKAAYLAQARKEIASDFYGSAQQTLSAMRLAAGLSQSQLADRAGTSQPYIARLEQGQHDPSTDVIARIAQALNAEPAAVFVAVRNQFSKRVS